ncbi:MAG: SIMPL domain-containing protein [Phycisphaerales bacterium]
MSNMASPARPAGRRPLPAALFSGVGLFMLGVSLALGFALAAQSIGKAMVSMRQERVIRVKGVAERPAMSDMAAWSGTVSVRSAALAEGSAKLAADVATLREFVRSAGFAEGDATESAVDLRPEFERDARGNSTNTVIGYALAQRLTVRSRDVQRVMDLSRTATSLLREGIVVESSPPAFTLADVDSIKMTLLAEATTNGRERAATLATGSGGRVGALRSATQGVFQIVPRGSTDVSDYGVSDTSAIEKSVKAVVTLEFAVEE